jgi:hypothetical protein
MGRLEVLFAVNRRKNARMPCSVFYQQAQQRLGYMTPLDAAVALNASLP